MSVIDWTAKPQPWRAIGLAFCRDLARICSTPLPPIQNERLKRGHEIRRRRDALGIVAIALGVAAGYANRATARTAVSQAERGLAGDGVASRLEIVLDRLEAERAQS